MDDGHDDDWDGDDGDDGDDDTYYVSMDIHGQVISPRGLSFVPIWTLSFPGIDGRVG